MNQWFALVNGLGFVTDAIVRLHHARALLQQLTMFVLQTHSQDKAWSLT